MLAVSSGTLKMPLLIQIRRKRYMKKKKNQKWFLCVLLAAVLFCSGCGNGTGIIRENTKETESEAVQGNKLEKGEKDTDLEKLEGAYDSILDCCTKECIGNKPIDENFLTWMTSNYGKEMIFAIAEEAEQGRMSAERWYELTGNSIQVLWVLYCKETGYQSDSLQNVYFKDCASEDETVMDFAGDINLSEGWATTKHMDMQENEIFDCFSPELIMEMQKADIMMLNNEYTYSTRGTAIPGKAYTFRAQPSRVEILNQLGVDIVSVANNHVYDYGKEALVDTLETLEEAGIPYVGAGRNLKEAKKIVYFVANGKKIAIVSATQIERSYNYTKEATEDTPGVLKTLKPDKFVSVIEEAKKNSDYVIVYPHWGTEGTNVYGSDQKELAKAYADAGADVIIGGHTHCLQGFSYVEGVPVLYSLGNFWFNSARLETGMEQVRIQKNGEIKVRFLPCMQENTKTRLLTEEKERTEVLDFMRRLSDGVEIDEEGYITNSAN